MTSRAGRDVPVARAAGSWPGSALSPLPLRVAAGGVPAAGTRLPLPRPRPSASIQDGGAEQRQQRGGGLAFQRGHGARAAAARARRLLRGRQRRQRRPGHPGGGERPHGGCGAHPTPATHRAPAPSGQPTAGGRRRARAERRCGAGRGPAGQREAQGWRRRGSPRRGGPGLLPHTRAAGAPLPPAGAGGAVAGGDAPRLAAASPPPRTPRRPGRLCAGAACAPVRRLRPWSRGGRGFPHRAPAEEGGRSGSGFVRTPTRAPGVSLAVTRRLCLAQVLRGGFVMCSTAPPPGFETPEMYFKTGYGCSCGGWLRVSVRSVRKCERAGHYAGTGDVRPLVFVSLTYFLCFGAHYLTSQSHGEQVVPPVLLRLKCKLLTLLRCFQKVE